MGQTCRQTRERTRLRDRESIQASLSLSVCLSVCRPSTYTVSTMSTARVYHIREGEYTCPGGTQLDTDAQEQSLIQYVHTKYRYLPT